MRKLLAVLMLCAALPVIGADRPGNLQPIPDPPPPSSGLRSSIPRSNRRSLYLNAAPTPSRNIRVAGKLYMLKVTPSTGRSYYLIDEKGDGKMSRQDSFDFRPASADVGNPLLVG